MEIKIIPKQNNAKPKEKIPFNLLQYFQKKIHLLKVVHK